MMLPAVLALSLCASAAEIQFTSSGKYDSPDGIHSWIINARHVLEWDGTPYIPAGVVFHSKYVSIEQTDDNWKEDIASLEALKSRGITDILLTAGGPISWTDPAAWQKLLAYLDSEGFTYGIDLSDGPGEAVSGYVVRPSRYRLPNVSADGDYSFGARDVTGGFFLLCTSRDGSVIRTGQLKITDGRMVATVATRRSSDYVLLAFPEVDLSGLNESLPDLWTGFDEYRDRLLRFFSKIKTGRGLRFILDPMAGSFGLVGQFENLIPSSPAFRLEFEAWLASKYPTPSNVCAAWGIIAQDVRSFEEAARLVPLWYGNKGTASAYDPISRKLHTVDVGGSTMWADIMEFRDSSIQRYMNDIADILKRQVADVPVLYRVRSFHRVYANGRAQGGFDGLAAAARGVGEALAEGEPLWAHSIAHESARSMWLIASSVRPPEGRYPSKAAMHVDLDFLKEIGVKGLFLSAVQPPRESIEARDLLTSPEQFDWLKEFGDKLAEAADVEPILILFPHLANVGALPGRLAESVWWTPSLRAGEVLSLGGGVIGYIFKDEDAVYLWTADGSRMKYTIPLRQGQEPRIIYPPRTENRAVVTREGLVIELDGLPLVLSGLEKDQLVPIEVAREEVLELEKAFAAAEKAGKKSPSTREALNRARMVLKNGRTQAAYEIAHTELIDLQEITGGYVWIEAEYPMEHNTNGPAAVRGASNGRYLFLNTLDDAPMAPYGASYGFEIPKDGNYDIYAAGSPPGENSSPMTFSIDGGQWQVADGTIGSEYGPSFVWRKLGSVTLSKGRHALTFNVVGRRRSDNAYFMALDAVLITPWPFTPEGMKRPTPAY